MLVDQGEEDEAGSTQIQRYVKNEEGEMVRRTTDGKKWVENKDKRKGGKKEGMENSKD